MGAIPQEILGLCLLGGAAGAGGAELIPAGSINGVFGHDRMAVVAEDHPAARRQARWVREQFFQQALALSDAEALERDLSGHNFLLYATSASPWVVRHAERLPFRFDDGAVLLEGRRFEGERLRVICAVRNPSDPERRAVLYVAQHPEDLSNINDVFHGPTEWLVADGERTLGSGSFVGTGSLSVEQLAADLDFLLEKLLAVHPAAVDGLPPALELGVAETRGAFGEPRSRAEAWVILSSLLARMGDAHTGLHPLRAGPYLQLPIVWLEEGPVVAADAGELRRGDRVLALAGHEPDALAEALREIVPAETGGWVRQRGQELLCDVTLLRGLELAGEEPVTVVVDRDGERLDVEPTLGEALPAEPERPWVDYAIEREADLAIFTVDRCQPDETYDATLRAFFDEVHAEEIGRVAIDVRRNGGGNSQVVNRFLRYVDVDTWRSYGGLVRESADSVAQRGRNFEDGVWEIIGTTRANPRVEDLPSFAGELFVLTTASTFSGGNWFAVILRDNDLARVVGEPTGNAPSSFGDTLDFTLPESSWSFSVSHKRWIRPDPERDPAECLVPDLRVDRTAEDVRLGRDPVLEMLRESGGR